MLFFFFLSIYVGFRYCGADSVCCAHMPVWYMYFSERQRKLPIKKSLNIARIVNQTGLLSSDPLWLDHLIHRDDAIRSQESQNTVKFTHGKTMVKWQLADILVVVNDGKSFELFTLDLETRFQPLSSKNTTKEKRKMVEECRTIYSPPGSCQHDSSPPHKFKVQTIHHS